MTKTNLSWHSEAKRTQKFLPQAVTTKRPFAGAVTKTDRTSFPRILCNEAELSCFDGGGTSRLSNNN